MKDVYRLHPVYGVLTDPYEIDVLDKQEEREMYERMQERMYYEQMEEEHRAYEAAMQEAMYFDYWMSLVIENEMITESN